MLEDADSIYEVPIKLYNEGLLKSYFLILILSQKQKLILSHNNFSKKIHKLDNTINVAIVGKYTNLSESYKSLNEALFHSGIFNETKVEISWIDSRKLNDFSKVEKTLKNVSQGILVPGGFGKDGAIGKINAIKFAKSPIFLLGICFGMQLAIIESMKSLKGLKRHHLLSLVRQIFP